MYLKLIRIALLSSLLVIIGCSTRTINKSKDSAALNVSLTSKLSAEVRVDLNKKLKGTASESILFGIFQIEGTNKYIDGISFGGGNSSFLSSLFLFGSGAAGRAKAAAAYNALKKAPGVDVIVSPQYVLQQKSQFFGAYKKIKAVVTGYAGHIKRIRNSN
jgi:hypothetical protein